MNEFIGEDIHLSVKLGAAWLDEHEPEWVERIHLESLKMDDCGQCILGQTYGDYCAVGITTDWAVEHGFEVYGRPGRDDYDPLTAAWTEYINQRREG